MSIKKLHPKSDLADCIPAFAAKEIRQAMRSRIFIWTFVSFHSLIPGLLFLVAYFAQQRSRETVMRDAWVGPAAIAILMIHLVILARAASLNQEMRSGAYELVCLSRLTSWRLIMHKWLTSLCFAPLLLASSLPYVFLFYLLTKCDLVAMLMALLAGFLYSAFSSALVIWASTVLSARRELHLLRSFLCLGLTVGSFWGLFILADSVLGRYGSTYRFAFSIFACLPFLTFLFLSLAASHLPMSGESHAWRRRLALLLSLPLLLLIIWPAHFEDTVIFNVILVTGFLVFFYDLLLPEPSSVPVAELPWRRYLFHPGRGSAWCFHFSILLQVAIFFYVVCHMNKMVDLAKPGGTPYYVPAWDVTAIALGLSLLVYPAMAILHHWARRLPVIRLVQILLLPCLCLAFFAPVMSRDITLNYRWPPPPGTALDYSVIMMRMMACIIPGLLAPLAVCFLPYSRLRLLLSYLFVELLLIGIASLHYNSKAEIWFSTPWYYSYCANRHNGEWPYICIWWLLTLPTVLLLWRSIKNPR